MHTQIPNTIRIPLDPDVNAFDIFGSLDANIAILRDTFHVEIYQRDGSLLVVGEEAEDAAGVLNDLLYILRTGDSLDAQKVHYVISLHEKGMTYREAGMNKDIICFTNRGKPIKPKTIGQTAYTRAIRTHDITFGIGPAGTGKTYIAVAMAATAFKNKEVQKILLARPAVEAGERLGFLPGDLQEKVDPYLRPLYDALYDILGRDTALRLKEREFIEVVPLAYMRGRTLDNAFIILDEAQNTTCEQMKMFLTRLGFGSKAVVTGDITQIDLPRGKRSGLLEALRVLDGTEGLAFCHLNEQDVIRHPLVRRIITAYDRYLSKNPRRDEFEEDEE